MTSSTGAVSTYVAVGNREDQGRKARPSLAQQIEALRHQLAGARGNRALKIAAKIVKLERAGRAS